MTDSQIVTIAVAVIIPVSTLLGGIFLQDARSTALRAEVVDALKNLREDTQGTRTDVREELKEIRDGIREIRKRLDDIERRGRS